MTILFDARRPVKPARPFAPGLAPAARPGAYRPTPEESAWAAAEFAAAEAAREAAHFDAMAAESYATDCLCRGLSPAEMG